VLYTTKGVPLSVTLSVVGSWLATRKMRFIHSTEKAPKWDVPNLASLRPWLTRGRRLGAPFRPDLCYPHNRLLRDSRAIVVWKQADAASSGPQQLLLAPKGGNRRLLIGPDR
jgi:hypothetical protein